MAYLGRPCCITYLSKFFNRFAYLSHITIWLRSISSGENYRRIVLWELSFNSGANQTNHYTLHRVLIWRRKDLAYRVLERRIFVGIYTKMLRKACNVKNAYTYNVKPSTSALYEMYRRKILFFYSYYQLTSLNYIWCHSDHERTIFFLFKMIFFSELRFNLLE